MDWLLAIVDMSSQIDRLQPHARIASAVSALELASADDAAVLGMLGL